MITSRLLLTALVVLAPLPALALPAITCHCFQDRSFDPARPAAADAYYLATVQNRLLARVFERSRKEIVLAKQTGTPGADLWVAFRAARVTGRPADELLAAREGQGGWPGVLADPAAALALSPGPAPDDDDELARRVAEEVLLETGLAAAGDLAALREAGSGLPEALMAALLGRVTGRPAPELWRAVRRDGRSWGELLAAAGLAEQPDALLQRAFAAAAPAAP